MKRWVEGGLGSFKAFWGYDATVSALPCHYGDDFVGGIFKTLGVEMVEGEEGGRGLLPHVRGMGRVMFDPAFETEDRWEGVLEAALARVRARLGSEGMAAVQWHAQNSLGGGPGGVFSARERLKLQDLFRRFVHALRADGEDLVWVTASEMAQLAERRWSSEGWPGWVRLRNYNEHPVAIDVSHARAQLLPRSPASPLGTARLWRVAGAGKSGSEKDAYGVAVLGSELDLDAGCEYVLALGASAADLPVAAQRLVLPSPINTRAAADRRGAEPRAVASGAERGWDVVEGEELEELQALGDQQREAAVQGVAEWAPNGVAAQAAVRWDVQAAAGSEGVMVSVWVDGFEFLSAESGVRAEIGYAALLLGHVRVATLFEPHRAIQVCAAFLTLVRRHDVRCPALTRTPGRPPHGASPRQPPRNAARPRAGRGVGTRGRGAGVGGAVPWRRHADGCRQQPRPRSRATPACSPTAHAFRRAVHGRDEARERAGSGAASGGRC